MQYEFVFKVKKKNWEKIIHDFLSHFEVIDFYKDGGKFKGLLDDSGGEYTGIIFVC